MYPCSFSAPNQVVQDTSLGEASFKTMELEGGMLEM